MPSRTRSLWTVSRIKNLCLLGIAGVVWLYPLFWVGSKVGRLPVRVPDRLWQQYNASALFTHRTPVWYDWKIEVCAADSGRWHVLNLEDVSPMPTSGYRQRMDRILGDTRSKKIGGSLRQRLAGWIAQRLKESAGMEVTGVRYYHRSWPTNTPKMAMPSGHWDGGIDVPATTKVTLLGTYVISEGQAVLEQPKPRGPAAMPPPAVFRRKTTGGQPGKP